MDQCTFFYIHHLLKNAVFFPLDSFSSFVKDQVTKGMWVYFWVFSSIPLICLPVTVPISCSFYHDCSVLQLEVKDGDSPRSSVRQRTLSIGQNGNQQIGKRSLPTFSTTKQTCTKQLTQHPTGLLTPSHSQFLSLNWTVDCLTVS